MAGIWVKFAVLAAGIAAPALAGVHPPEVEARLAFIVGDWTIAGQEAVYRDRCSWFGDRSFVVCDTADRRRSPGHRSIAVLGWSSADAHYTYQQYDDSGRSRSEPCFASAQGGLTCLGEMRGKDGLVQTRSHIWPQGGGVGIRQERSVNAGPWTDVGQVEYVRAR